MPRRRIFTPDQVSEIRENKDGHSQRWWAQKLKVSQMTIWRIVSGHVYKDCKRRKRGG